MAKDIVWLGRIMPRKGLTLALQAFDEVDYMPCRLVIVGDGPARVDAEELTRSSRRRSDIVFVGDAIH